MAPDEFAFLARLLRRRCGLSLTPDKKALTTRRLAPVMRRFDFKNMASLIGELRLGREALADAVTEAMTVNESSFFRDAAMFRNLRETVLPRLAAARSGDKRLRIWSAACAAGQEAYSIAILLSEMGLAREGWNIDLIATDLSGEAIARADAQGAIALLRHVYEHHPPIRATDKLGSVAPDDLTKTLQSAVVHYHPDKHPKGGDPVAAAVANFICKRLTAAYQRFK
jgi:hypothetical protein